MPEGEAIFRTSPTQDELLRSTVMAARLELYRMYGWGLIDDDALREGEDSLRRLKLRAFLGRIYPDERSAAVLILPGLELL